MENGVFQTSTVSCTGRILLDSVLPSIVIRSICSKTREGGITNEESS